jgi:molybdopterin adenylyltransferase
MGHHEHRANAPESISVAILSVSSSRTLADDESGHWMAGHAQQHGYNVAAHQVVDDDIGTIRQALLKLLADPAPDAVIVTGGTGITPKDVTIEALRPLFTKELTAFGALFAQLSYAQIDSAAIMSRASAGVIGRALVFCLPGSKKACQLACNALIFPELGHLIAHSSGG